MSFLSPHRSNKSGHENMTILYTALPTEFRKDPLYSKVKGVLQLFMSWRCFERIVSREEGPENLGAVSVSEH